MKTLHISVVDKIATYLQRDGAIVCGNADYQILFAFDSEWEEYPERKARFIWNGERHDQVFTGNICRIPVINDATEVIIGVFAGDLATTPTVIPCKKSIRCGALDD
jgi:hypothetical protein